MVVPDEQEITETNISRPQSFSIWEQRSVVRYLHSQAFLPDEIYKNLQSACGESAPPYHEVKEWIDDLEQIKEDGETVASASAGSRTGPGIDTPTDPALVARIDLLLIKDRRIGIERAASMACVSNITAAAVINNVLGLKKVCARWVPRLWTPEQKAYRANVCRELMKIHEEKGDEWLDKLIVGDEAFAMYYCPDSANGPIHKKPSPERVSKESGDKYKPSIEPRRAYCLFFYDSQGFLAAELLNTSRPPDAVEYSRILREVLVPAIRRRRKSVAKGYFLLQDPTPAHSSLTTQKTLKEIGITTLPHAPASPDLEPHEYFLLRNLFKKVDGLHFRSVADLWKKVQRTIFQHSDIDFNKSIKSLPERWNLCIEREGEILADL